MWQFSLVLIFCPRVSCWLWDVAGGMGGERGLLGHAGEESLCAWSAGGVCSMTLCFSIPLGGRPLGCLLTWWSSAPGPAPGALQPSLLPDPGQVAWLCPCCRQPCACSSGSLPKLALISLSWEAVAGKTQRYGVRYNVPGEPRYLSLC